MVCGGGTRAEEWGQWCCESSGMLTLRRSLLPWGRAPSGRRPWCGLRCGRSCGRRLWHCPASDGIARDYCIVKVGTAKVGIAKVGTAKVGIAQVGKAQVGIVKVGIAKDGLAKVRIA